MSKHDDLEIASLLLRAYSRMKIEEHHTAAKAVAREAEHGGSTVMKALLAREYALADLWKERLKIIPRLLTALDHPSTDDIKFVEHLLGLDEDMNDNAPITAGLKERMQALRGAVDAIFKRPEDGPTS